MKVEKAARSEQSIPHRLFKVARTTFEVMASKIQIFKATVV
jgi:hypothetical protein